MFFPEQTAIWLSRWTWLTSLTSRTSLKSTPFAFFFLIHVPFFFSRFNRSITFADQASMPCQPD